MRLLSLITLTLVITLLSALSNAEGINFRHRSELSPSDYLSRENTRRDSSFDTLPVAKLNLNLGIGSDCGSIKLDASLKAALSNIFDSNFFGNLGQDILDSSWMLVICYLSPNWCSILRHFRLNANFIGRMRQNQCDAINKYIDSRVSEAHQARSECVSRVLERGGNTEEMAEKCGNRKLWDFDLKSWSGSGRNETVNRLLSDSAKWAKFGDRDTLNLVKQFVGDTVVAKGKVKVEYGPKAVYIPPKRHLVALVKKKNDQVCREMLRKIDESDQGIEAAISESDLRKINGNQETEYIDRQTLRYLSLLPNRKRRQYCKKIAWALANAQFNHDTSEALSFLSLASTNPNLPEKRRDEILQKKQLLQDDIDSLKSSRSEVNHSVNLIAAQINREGQVYQQKIVERENQVSRARAGNYRTNSLFFNCVTPAMCDQGGF